WGRDGQTDGNGVVHLRGVWASRAGVEITARSYQPATLSIHPSDDAEAVVTKTVELRRGAPVSGTVVDPNGRVVANAEISVRSVETGWTGTVRTDADGTWNIDALCAGKHLFSAVSEVYGAAPDLAVDLDGRTRRSGVAVHLVYGAQLVGTVV